MKLFKKCIYLRYTTFISIRLETIFFFIFYFFFIFGEQLDFTQN